MIKVSHLFKAINGQEILKDINLDLARGEITVILGESGSGKSVLLQHLIGLFKPDRGSVEIDGQDITKMHERDLREVRKGIGYLFQDGALYDFMTVAENVAFPLQEHTNLKSEQILEKAHRTLKTMGLEGAEGKYPSELSGGMKKRVSLARAIFSRPSIILYDEPTTGVDPITAAAINELIKNLHDKLQVTSIVVTHDMTSAYYVADSIAMLYKGKIIIDGSPSEIQNTEHPVVRQFITGAAKGPITESIDTDHP